MTPYQRGCRDALLDLAAQLDKAAGTYAAAADKNERGRGYKPSIPAHMALVSMYRGQAMALREAADRARALAERTPDDPEEPTP